MSVPNSPKVVPKSVIKVNRDREDDIPFNVNEVLINQNTDYSPSVIFPSHVSTPILPPTNLNLSCNESPIVHVNVLSPINSLTDSLSQHSLTSTDNHTHNSSDLPIPAALLAPTTSSEFLGFSDLELPKSNNTSTLFASTPEHNNKETEKDFLSPSVRKLLTRTRNRLAKYKSTQASMGYSDSSDNEDEEIGAKGEMDTDVKNKSPCVKSKYNSSTMGEYCDGPPGQNDENDDHESFIKMMGLLTDSKALLKENLKKVGYCDGTCPDKTQKWLRDVSDQKHPIEIASLASEGPLAEFITKELQQAKRDKKKLGWSTLKISIAKEFISQDFQKRQAEALETLQQRSGESLVGYNYEFKRLMREAFPKMPDDQSSLVRTYLSSLIDRDMARSIISKEKPTSVNEAIKAVERKAKADELLKPRVKGGRNALIDSLPDMTSSVDMSKVETAVDKLTTRISQLESSQKQVHDSVNQVAAVAAHKSNSLPTRPNTKPVVECYRCGKKGHYARECRAPDTNPKPNPRLQQRPPRPSAPFNPQIRCNRCRRWGHHVRNCAAGAPSTPCYCGGLHWLYDCPQQRSQVSGTPRGNSNPSQQGNQPARQ